MAETLFAINGKFLRAETTGVHRVAAELANGLAALAAEKHSSVAGMRFEVWAPHDGVERAREIALPLRVIGPLTGIPWEQLTLPLRRGGATLVNLCNIGPALSRDAVTMIHDVQVHLSPDSYALPFRLWYHAIQPALARRHRRILTVSNFSRERIAEVGLCPLDRIGVVHNGVDHLLRVASDPGAIDRLGLERDRYVLALSTTQAHKNIRVLIAAADRLAAKGIELVLAGGTRREAFEAAGLRVPDHVRFTGRVSDGELRGLMEGALCLAFPSTTEGFGLPPLEAMSVGCPAMVAPCGALPEVCGDAALYAPPDDPDAWAASLSDLVENPTRRDALVVAGRAQAARFTWRAASIRLAEELRAANLKA